MSTSYSFTDDNRVTVGNATKKSDYDTVAENTDELNERLEGIPYLGQFFSNAGGVSYSYNSDGTINQISHTTSPVGTISYDYNSDGTINYVELAITDPISATIRDTYSYNSDGTMDSIARTVS